jgi:diguanylate cyclase (GGDEF)-like protein/PAS domain S-box-containing protein
VAGRLPGWSTFDDQYGRLMVEASSDIVCVLRFDGTVEWVSPSVTSMGMTPSDLVGRSPWQLIHSQDADRAAEAVAELVRTGSVPDGLEIRVRRANGAYRWMSAHGHRVQAAGRGAGVFVVALQDVDELVRARAALAAAEERFQLVVDRVSDVVFIAGPDRKVQWISDSVTKSLGWDPQDLAGTLLRRIVHPEDRATWAELREHLYAGGEVSEHPRRTLIRLRAKDETYRWMTGTAAPFTDDTGEILGVAVGMRDVEDLVTAQLHAIAGQQRLRATLDSLIDPCIVLAAVRDGSGRIVDFEYTDVNEAACTYNRMPRERLVGTRVLELFPGLERAGLMDACVRTIETGQPLILDDPAYANEVLDEVRRYDLRGTKSGDSLVLTWRDVTDRHKTRQRLEESEALYRLVTDDVWDAVVRSDASGELLWVSPSFETLTGHSAEQVVGTSGLTLIADESLPGGERIFADLRTEGLPQESVGQIRRADGSLRWIRARSRPFVRADGSTDGFVTVMRDAQTEVETRKSLDREIGHDSLTGLAAWPLAKVRVQAALADGRTSGRSVALLCLGVDRLKQVNEAVSYAGGDLVLSTVARRIVGAVGDPNAVARVAGDEFAVLLTDLANGADASLVAQRLRDAVSGLARIGTEEVVQTVSMGIAVAEPGSTPDGLLRHASLAMHAAQAVGRDRWQFADPALADEAARRLQLETRLRAALPGGEVVAWYQPIASLGDEVRVGYEALARWVPPGREAMNPAAFLDVAERSGLISPLDLTMMEQVARSSSSFPPDVSFAVNVASPTLAMTGYADQVATILETYRLDPSRLRLEATETMLLQATPVVRGAMNELADLGVKWFVDDFGTGYSSLSHIRDLPIHGLKLDQSFTSGLESREPAAVQLAGGLAGLAKGLGLDTVAEGIETESQAAILREQGWSKGQGWLFGRPAPVSTVTEKSTS